jgi:hypothetical protein
MNGQNFAHPTPMFRLMQPPKMELFPDPDYQDQEVEIVPLGEYRFIVGVWKWFSESPSPGGSG